MKTIATILFSIIFVTTAFAGNNNTNHNKSNIRKEVFVKKVKRNKIIVNELLIKNNRTVSGERKVYDKNGKLLKSRPLKIEKINLLHQSRQHISMRIPFSDRIKTNPKYRA
ncbi:MAG: hypothetical protein L3J74_04875 [Bacteroidales bacterium]|nr:hypothetical protein [Bacteroidales bacterium]